MDILMDKQLIDSAIKHWCKRLTCCDWLYTVAYSMCCLDTLFQTSYIFISVIFVNTAFYK